MNSKKVIVLTAILCVVTWGFLISTQSAFAQPKKDNEQIIKRIYELASEGKLYLSGPFKLGSHKSELISKWGNPDRNDQGVYYYDNRRVTFVLDDSKNVRMIDNYGMNSKYTDIKLTFTVSEVKNALGKPTYNTEHRASPGATLCYDLPNGYHLQFHFYEDKLEMLTLTLPYPGIHDWNPTDFFGEG
jgi:hypothetical protein